jgi:hypothetical protein
VPNQVKALLEVGVGANRLGERLHLFVDLHEPRRLFAIADLKETRERKKRREDVRIIAESDTGLHRWGR